MALVGVASSVVAAPLLFGAAGAGGSISWTAGNTLLQRVAPDEVLARVFGILEGLGMLGAAVGATGAAALIGLFGVRATLLVVGLLLVAAVGALWFPLAAIDREASAPEEEALQLVRSMPVFASLPPPALERIVTDLIGVDLPAGHVLMREGDPGDRCYLIAEGRAEIVRGGVVVDESGKGGLIGEIALLRDVPRTATVVALTPIRAFTLEREPFLAAVTGHPQSRERAEALAEARVPRRRR